jgi:DNA-binding transcriptional ArsR family regulator
MIRAMSETATRAPGTTCFDAERVALLRNCLPDDADLDLRAEQLKALAHPGRLAAVLLLAQEECCVCDVANALGQPVSTVSEHLRRLKYANLVSSRRDGRFVFYALRDGTLAAAVLRSVQGREARSR